MENGICVGNIYNLSGNCVGGKNNSGGEKAVSVKAKEPIQRKVYT